MRELVRIANTNIRGKERLHSGLSKIYGVGYSLSNAICNRLDFDKFKKVGDLTDDEVKKIEDLLKNHHDALPVFLFNRKKDLDTGKDIHLLSADLKLRTEFDIRLMKKIKSYKGIRHALGQPVRGQRTKSHFRTGATVGVMKKQAKLLAQKSEDKKEKK